MSSLWQDMRDAWRSIRLHALFSSVGVLIIAVGLGAAVVVFDVAWLLFRQPLPFEDGSRLVRIGETRDGAGYYPMSYLNYHDYRTSSETFEELASHYSNAPVQVVSEAHAGTLSGGVVSGNFFRMLRIEPRTGRFFGAEEAAPAGAHPVTVISFNLWRDWFEENSEVLGSVMTINGVSFEIVGVAPEAFHGVVVGSSVDLWIPSGMSHVGYRWCDTFSRDCSYLRLLGRLAPERTLAEASAELEAIAQRLRQAYPEVNRGKGVTVVPAAGIARGDRRPHQLTRLLSAVIGCLLALACVNLAGLLLVRNTGRQREVAVRMALGATRSRIARQLQIESLIMSTIGCGACLVIASWARSSIFAFYGFEQTWLSGSLAMPSLIFAAGMSVLIGVAVGAMPAIEATRLGTPGALHSRTGSLSHRQGRLRTTLVIGQVALSLTLVVTGILLTRSFTNLLSDQPFATDSILAMRLRPRLLAYDAERGRHLQQEVIERLEKMAGVKSVGAALGYPMFLGPSTGEVFLPGDDVSRPRVREAGIDAVTPGYFETIQLPLIRGREFGVQDRRRGPPVVIVNQTLALALWGGADPIGRVLISEDVEYRVVGVVADAHPHSAIQSPHPHFYRAYWQLDDAIDSRLVVRVDGDAGAYAQPIRKEIARVDPQVPITEVSTLRQKIEEGYRPLRLALTVTHAAGGAALLLTWIGIYSLLALMVSQRVHEIGIRMALGARGLNVILLFVRKALFWSVAGILLGIPLALALSSILGGFLYGIDVADVTVYLGASIVLVGLTLVASSIPLHRAVTIEPSTALRRE